LLSQAASPWGGKKKKKRGVKIWESETSPWTPHGGEKKEKKKKKKEKKGKKSNEFSITPSRPCRRGKRGQEKVIEPRKERIFGHKKGGEKKEKGRKEGQM